MFCDRDFTDAANMRKHKLKEHPTELAAFEGDGRRKRKSRAIVEERLDMSFEEEVTMDEED